MLEVNSTNNNLMIDPIKKTTTEESREVVATFDYVQLPSEGIYYTGAFKGLKQVRVRKLDWEDDDILTTKSYYDNGTLFDEILKNCVIEENGFKSEYLIDIDRDAVLWWLRINAFGQEYKVPRECPSCEHEQEVTWDLGSFEVVPLSSDYKDEILENGTVTVILPISKLRVVISTPSCGKENTISKRLRTKKEKSKTTKDFNNTGRLISVIREAYQSDETKKSAKDYNTILEWLKTGFDGSPLPLVDSRYIQQVAREIKVKVNTSLNITCAQCEKVEENVAMPMTIYFFWPDFDNLKGEDSKEA